MINITNITFPAHEITLNQGETTVLDIHYEPADATETLLVKPAVNCMINVPKVLVQSNGLLQVEITALKSKLGKGGALWVEADPSEFSGHMVINVQKATVVPCSNIYPVLPKQKIAVGEPMDITVSLDPTNTTEALTYSSTSGISIPRSSKNGNVYTLTVTGKERGMQNITLKAGAITKDVSILVDGEDTPTDSVIEINSYEDLVAIDTITIKLGASCVVKGGEEWVNKTGSKAQFSITKTKDYPDYQFTIKGLQEGENTLTIGSRNSSSLKKTVTISVVRDQSGEKGQITSIETASNAYFVKEGDYVDIDVATYPAGNTETLTTAVHPNYSCSLLRVNGNVRTYRVKCLTGRKVISAWRDAHVLSFNAIDTTKTVYLGGYAEKEGFTTTVIGDITNKNIDLAPLGSIKLATACVGGSYYHSNTIPGTSTNFQPSAAVNINNKSGDSWKCDVLKEGWEIHAAEDLITLEPKSYLVVLTVPPTSNTKPITPTDPTKPTEPGKPGTEGGGTGGTGTMGGGTTEGGGEGQKEDKPNINPIPIESDATVTTTTKDEYPGLQYYNADFKGDLQSNKDTLEIEAYPRIRTADGRYIHYTQFLTKLTIDLKNIFSASSVKLGTDYYNYVINGKKATLNFNIDCPIVSSGEIALDIYAYPLSAYYSNGYESLDNITDWVKTTGAGAYDGVGQQIIPIELPQEEDVYILRFDLGDDLSTSHTYKLLICSELMNNYDTQTYPDFSAISIQEWGHYLGELVNKDINFSWKSATQKDLYSESTYDKDFWEIAKGAAGNTGFYPTEDKHLTTIDSFKRGWTYTLNDCSLTGEMRQRYLYNFCKVSYTDDSFITLNNTAIPINDILEQGLERTIDTLDANVYVQANYEVVDPILDNSINLENLIRVAKDNKDYWLGIEVFHDSSGTKYWLNTRCTVFDPTTKTVTADENLYSETHKNASISSQKPMVSSAVSKAVVDTLKKWNTGCVFADVLVTANTSQKSVGFSTECYNSVRYQNQGKISWHLFGLIFMQKNGPLFIPITEFEGKEGTPLHYNEKLWCENTDKNTPSLQNASIKWLYDPSSTGTNANARPESTKNTKVINVLRSLRDGILVNTKKYDSLIDGAYIQKDRAKETIEKKDIDITTKIDSEVSSIIAADTELISGQLTFNDERLSFTNFNGQLLFQNRDSYEIPLLDKKVNLIEAFNPEAWPLKAISSKELGRNVKKTIENLSIEELDAKASNINIAIQEKQHYVDRLGIKDRINTHQSVGFYIDPDIEVTEAPAADTKLVYLKKEDLKFIEDLLTVGCSDAQYPTNGLVPEYNVHAESGDLTDEVWAFCDESKDRSKGDLEFTDASDNPRDPRQRVFYCNTAKYILPLDTIKDLIK